ncbi:protein ORF89 [Anguillid herpesvirus 1]|uniref:Protein ORF89 n=1 Tax=Anguillid herpesvirus 1 TaxID=150286 RepID=A0A8E5AP31_9VIRU|nr:protein ORF89 [Anguillid herpesvirus 1]ADA57852.1 protein ORF89 [Anguillid herpesvirus 1]QRM16382.1 protein ORF89 [Anguillid herpesvirus 1]QRM16641.1 protein ORF89 [Anguillid herpesvirus 1]QRM16904.1 protein ORF89 [Anguillid herpesvirus 1]QRM17166.1 protein ORF89 [Anguillid herpesvirus 1]
MALVDGVKEFEALCEAVGLDTVDQLSKNGHIFKRYIEAVKKLNGQKRDRFRYNYREGSLRPRFTRRFKPYSAFSVRKMDSMQHKLNINLSNTLPIDLVPDTVSSTEAEKVLNTLHQKSPDNTAMINPVFVTLMCEGKPIWRRYAYEFLMGSVGCSDVIQNWWLNANVRVAPDEDWDNPMSLADKSSVMALGAAMPWKKIPQKLKDRSGSALGAAMPWKKIPQNDITFTETAKELRRLVARRRGLVVPLDVLNTWNKKSAIFANFDTVHLVITSVWPEYVPVPATSVKLGYILEFKYGVTIDKPAILYTGGLTLYGRTKGIVGSFPWGRQLETVPPPPVRSNGITRNPVQYLDSDDDNELEHGQRLLTPERSYSSQPEVPTQHSESLARLTDEDLHKEQTFIHTIRYIKGPTTLNKLFSSTAIDQPTITPAIQYVTPDPLPPKAPQFKGLNKALAAAFCPCCRSTFASSYLPVSVCPTGHFICSLCSPNQATCIECRAEKVPPTPLLDFVERCHAAWVPGGRGSELPDRSQTGQI